MTKTVAYRNVFTLLIGRQRGDYGATRFRAHSQSFLRRTLTRHLLPILNGTTTYTANRITINQLLPQLSPSFLEKSPLIQQVINNILPDLKNDLFNRIHQHPNKSALALITQHPLLIFSKTNNGKTPLHTAAEMGDSKLIKYLIVSGTNINKRRTDNRFFGITPLHLAAINGHLDAVTILVDFGAQLNASLTNGDLKGTTPLHFAAWKGHLHIVELLVNHGADVKAKDRLGATPLLVATKEGKIAVVTFFIANNLMAINTADNEGWTPLHVATKYGYLNLVRALLNADATPNIAISSGIHRGITALDLAEQKGYQRIVTLFKQVLTKP